jgi:hypothetical protein
VHIKDLAQRPASVLSVFSEALHSFKGRDQRPPGKNTYVSGKSCANRGITSRLSRSIGPHFRRQRDSEKTIPAEQRSWKLSGNYGSCEAITLMLKGAFALPCP